MKTNPARAKEFNYKLAAYSATATAVLLAVPAANAQGSIQNITDFTVNSADVSGPLTCTNGGATLNFEAGPFAGEFFGTHRNINAEGHFLNYFHKGTTFAKPLNLGNAIVGAGNFSSHASEIIADPGFIGGFNPVGGVGYIGFKTVQHGQTYYGWLRVQLAEIDGSSNVQTVSLIAKNGEPGIFGAFAPKSDDITAGEIGAVPEPSLAALGGLGLLALGAQGVREMRRRKNPIAAGN